MKRRVKTASQISAELRPMQLAARAQQSGPVPRIGYLSPVDRAVGFFARDQAFRRGLKSWAMSKGRMASSNTAWQTAIRPAPCTRQGTVPRQGRRHRCCGHAGVLAARAATKTIPIVCWSFRPGGLGLTRALRGPAATSPAHRLRLRMVGKSPRISERGHSRAGRLCDVLPESSQCGLSDKDVEGGGDSRRRVEPPAQSLRSSKYERTGSAFDATAPERPDALLVLADPFLIFIGTDSLNLRRNGVGPPSMEPRARRGRWPHAMGGRSRVSSGERPATSTGF